MGGIGSGAQRSTHVGNVEDMLTLDIRALKRLGVLRTGECVIDNMYWSIGGLSTAYARLRVDICDIERGGTLTITGDMPGGAITQHIAIEALPSSFGGYRCYFVCPVTAARCEILYYADGHFASRKAQRLSYIAQGMTDLSRARRKIAKLHSRLEGTNGFRRRRGRKRTSAVQALKHAVAEAYGIHIDRLRGYVDISDTGR